MRRSRITITLNQRTLEQVDRLIDHKQIRNRSHAIEFVLGKHLQGKVHTAVILAGGQGTQLRPYTYEVPKSMLTVHGKPILEHMINQLKQSNITEIILCIGYLGDKINAYFGNGSKWGVHITYVEEKEPLQTGGALLKARKYVHDGTFLVIHGDILTSLHFENLIHFHENEHSTATVALIPLSKPQEYGQITIQGTRLMNFYKKDSSTIVKSLLIHAGIYVFSSDIFSYFPTDDMSFLLEDVLEKLITQKKVSGYLFEGQWFDVGTTENYEAAIKEFKDPSL